MRRKIVVFYYRFFKERNVGILERGCLREILVENWMRMAFKYGIIDERKTLFSGKISTKNLDKLDKNFAQSSLYFKSASKIISTTEQNSSRFI